MAHAFYAMISFFLTSTQATLRLQVNLARSQLGTPG